jgi:hypothetical protein
MGPSTPYRRRDNEKKKRKKKEKEMNKKNKANIKNNILLLQGEIKISYCRVFLFRKTKSSFLPYI